MSQTRAEQTRRRVIRAGATEFAKRGYEGTALTRITSSAGVTMGALTFHFSTKKALADAVCAQGCEVTRATVSRALGGTPSSLQAIVDITHLLVLLLQDDATVRAASRLGEQASEHWYSSWVPSVHALSARAAERGELLPRVDPVSVTVLAISLVAAGERSALHAVCAHTGVRPYLQLTQTWDTVLSGIRSRENDSTFHPGGTPR